jgi:signal transduction histidine kinase
LRAHPRERDRSVLFQEEARAERLANLIRVAYLLAWLGASAFYAPGNFPEFNRINFGAGGLWLAAAVGYQAFLERRAYAPAFKYASTAFDIAASTLLLGAFASEAGPAFALKMPIFLNYFCCLGLAALRFHRGLALFATCFSTASFLTLWMRLDRGEGLAYGDSAAHAERNVVHAYYLADEALYLVVFGVLLVAASMNARRHVRLRVAEGERAACEEERALMAAGLAHEIKNPLGGIFGAAQLLSDEGRVDRGFTEIILGESRRLADVVEGFLRYARPYPVKPEEIDLAALTEAFCGTQGRLAPGSPVEFASPFRSLPARTDPEAVRQILLNLLQNARRHQGDGAPVRIGLDRRGERFHLRVEDEGAGVAPELRATLFEPFHSATPGGNGLGLALSRRIAHALGGDLAYEPLPRGSRFVLSLPADPFARA